nr:MAG TPA: hypothetical protein [Caudoviricetes sp.]
MVDFVIIDSVKEPSLLKMSKCSVSLFWVI